jgi:hypothetical protein
MDIVTRYLPLLEDIGADVSELQPFDLFILHGAVLDDDWFSQRTQQARNEWEASHPELSPEHKQLADCKYDFPRTAAKQMTKAEKEALRVRVGLK